MTDTSQDPMFDTDGTPTVTYPPQPAPTPLSPAEAEVAAVLAMLADLEQDFVAQTVADDLEAQAQWAGLTGGSAAELQRTSALVRAGRIPPQPPLPGC